MLGLYDGAGDLSHVGVIGAFPAEQRRQLVEVLAPYRVGSDGGPKAIPGPAGPAAAEAAGPRLPGPGAAGTPRRTSASSCSAPTWWSKLPTSTCKARGCAIPPSSGVGAPTAMRAAAPTTSSTPLSLWSWLMFSGRLSVLGPAECGRGAPARGLAEAIAARAGEARVATGSDFAASP